MSKLCRAKSAENLCGGETFLVTCLRGQCFLWKSLSLNYIVLHCFTNHFDDPWLLIFHFGFRLEKQKALRLWSSPKLSRVFWTYGLITRIYLAEMYSTSDKVIFQPPKAQFFKTNSIDFYLFSNGFFSTLILLSTIISLLPERLFVN